MYSLVQVYQEGTVNLSLNCAREAAKHNVRMFVEFSTGQVYAADKVDRLRSQRMIRLICDW